ISAKEANMLVTIGSILQKGVNDDNPTRLFNLYKQIGGQPHIRFRNIMPVGRWAAEKDNNWTLNEMLWLVCNQLDIDFEWARNWNKNNNYMDEKDHYYFPLDESRRIKTPWIKLTDWATPTQENRKE